MTLYIRILFLNYVIYIILHACFNVILYFILTIRLIVSTYFTYLINDSYGINICGMYVQYDYITIVFIIIITAYYADYKYLLNCILK